jgi:hypothetical protein
MNIKLPKYISLQHDETNEHYTLDKPGIAETGDAFRVIACKKGHSLQGLCSRTKSSGRATINGTNVQLNQAEKLWIIECVDKKRGIMTLRDVDTDQFLDLPSNSGATSLSNTPVAWRIFDKTQEVNESQTLINAYVANTFIITPDGAESIDPDNLIIETNKTGSYQKAMNQLFNVSGKEGLKAWRRGHFEFDNKTMYIRFMENQDPNKEYADLISFTTTPEISAEATSILTDANLKTVDYLQIILKYFRQQQKGKSDIEETTVYTTLLVENKDHLSDEMVLEAFLNGFVSSTVLSADNSLDNGLSTKGATIVQDNMDGPDCRLLLKSITSLSNADNAIANYVKGNRQVDEVSKMLINTFISQVPEAAMLYTWFFGFTKAYGIDASVKNFTNKPCDVKIAYFDNVDISANEQDLSQIVPLNSCSAEGDSVSIPGLPIPITTSDDAPAYANYIVANDNTFFEGVGILIEIAFEGSDTVFSVVVDVPRFGDSGVNCQVKDQSDAQKEFKALAKHTKLEEHCEHGELRCEVTLDYKNGAPGAIYHAMIILKD